MVFSEYLFRNDSVHFFRDTETFFYGLRNGNEARRDTAFFNKYQTYRISLKGGIEYLLIIGINPLTITVFIKPFYFGKLKRDGIRMIIFSGKALAHLDNLLLGHAKPATAFVIYKLKIVISIVAMKNIGGQLTKLFQRDLSPCQHLVISDQVLMLGIQNFR